MMCETIFHHFPKILHQIQFRSPFSHGKNARSKMSRNAQLHRLFAKETEDMNEDNNIVIITPASRVRWILCRRECRRGCGFPARSSAWWRPAAGQSRCSRPRWSRRLSGPRLLNIFKGM